MTAKNKINFFTFVLFVLVFFPYVSKAATVQGLIDRYTHVQKIPSTGSGQAGDKVRILIVPGHDNQYWGTEYRTVREADLNLTLAENIYALLKKDSRFEVMITRDSQDYLPEFKAYFTQNRDVILTFASDNRKKATEQMAGGAIKNVTSTPHNTANQDVAVRLYGINKWVNEHNIDLVLHVHFNDTPSRPSDNPGPYHGIVVYIPESQYRNAAISKAFGRSVYDSLSKYYSPSTMPWEVSGLVEDQDLIAIGASNTLSSAATALVEYGYIYEPQFLDAAVSKAVMSDMAFQTFLGIHSFFGDKATYTGKYGTPLLPHTWKTPVAAGELYNLDVLSLQAALRSKGLYPMPDRDYVDCRMTGNFNPCTKAGLQAFQKKYGIDQTGTLGPITRKKLNQLFGS